MNIAQKSKANAVIGRTMALWDIEDPTLSTDGGWVAGNQYKYPYIFTYLVHFLRLGPCNAEQKLIINKVLDYEYLNISEGTRFVDPWNINIKININKY
jgi:hypothetical protein